MTDTNLSYQSLRVLSDRLESGELSAEQLVQHYLTQISGRDEKLHAFVAVYGEDALNAAKAADLARRAGHQLGPLHGIPIAVKDIIDMEGRVTTGGSPMWLERRSPSTAKLVEHLQRAGMIVIGKTHTVEFAMGGWGTNTGMGTPWNPWDLETHRAPGGSSSGSGVAVAADFAPCAIGTDTGGSVRLPSAWNGLSGLKTTIGNVSTEGVLPLAHTLDTPGPMCRTVADCALLFEVLRGNPATRWDSEAASLKALEKNVAGLRLGVIGQSDLDLCDSEVQEAFHAAVQVLTELGAEVEAVDLGESVDELGARVGHIIGIEGYSWVGTFVDDPSQPIDPDIRPRIQLGRDRSAVDYLERLREQQAFKQAVEARTRHLDAVLSPAVAFPAPAVASIDQNQTPATFTRFVNYLEWCAMVVPCGTSMNGLPLSLQIACRGHEESMAIQIGAAYQRSTTWHNHHPVL